jgi:hypothetical protein
MGIQDDLIDWSPKSTRSRPLFGHHNTRYRTDNKISGTVAETEIKRTVNSNSVFISTRNVNDLRGRRREHNRFRCHLQLGAAMTQSAVVTTAPREQDTRPAQMMINTMTNSATVMK